MYRGINIVDMYLAGDYPFNEYPGFATFRRYLNIAKNDLNCNFIRLFLLRDFKEHYPDWINRWVAVENLIQEYNFAVEYCTYMFWPSATVNIDSYKNWVDKYIGTYRDLGMPTERIWTVNILESPWVNYNISQQMTPYIKLVDPGRTVTTEVWGTPGGTYNDEIIGLPSTKGEPLISNRAYIQSGNLVSTADYSGAEFIPTTDLWTHIKTHVPTSPVLISEFSGDITNRVNIAITNGAYGVCYWNLHLTDEMATREAGIQLRCPINSDFTLNSIGIELRNSYANLMPPVELSVTTITGPDSATAGETATFIATVINMGTESGNATVTFYGETNTIDTQQTGTINPGEIKYIFSIINSSTLGIGAHDVCAKISDERIYCKPFEVKAATSPPPVTEAGMSPILIGGLAIGALMMMSKKT